MAYDLWYWPSIPGRGEFVRLPLEALGIAYHDRGQEEGFEAVAARLEAMEEYPAYAVPLLDTGSERIAQTAHILAYLDETHGRAPADPVSRRFVHQLQLTISDMVEEAHRTHHPVSVYECYEDQKDAAVRNGRTFGEKRIPKFLGYFEKIAAANPSGWLVGDEWTSADSSLFQLIEGLRHAFPRAMAAGEADWPAIIAIRDRFAALPDIAAYLASERRLPFSDGIFRHYPEVDA